MLKRFNKLPFAHHHIDLFVKGNGDLLKRFNKKQPPPEKPDHLSPPLNPAPRGVQSFLGNENNFSGFLGMVKFFQFSGNLP